MRLTATIILTGLLMIPGCQPAQPISRDVSQPEPVTHDALLPTYAELIERYNATARPLTKVWAVARVDLDWLDENGKRKSEHGDGRFMYIAPDQVALEIQEFGKGFWAGGDGEQYWLFELQDQKTLYVGRFDQLNQRNDDAFPLPVKPTDLLYVLGLVPIDPTKQPEAPAVEWVAGHYLVEPPGLGIRMLLHPDTARPARVDLLDQAGESAVKCLLSEPVELERSDGSPDSGKPILPSFVEVYVLGQDARMTLRLKSPTTDGRRIKDTHFNLGLLTDVYKPNRTVDLDAPAPH